MIPETQKRSSYRRVLFVIIFALGYSILRYNIFKGVGWEHLPLYVVNKVVALTGVILIGMSVLVKNKSDDIYSALRKKQYNLTGYLFISLHVIASLTLLNKGYYEKFFTGTQMNLTGELSMFLGILAFSIYSVSILRSWLEDENIMERASLKKRLVYRYTTHIFVMGHLVVMGLASWILPSEWPGYMLPISFLSFLFLLFILPVSLQNRQGGK